MQSEAEAIRQSQRLSGQNPEYAPMCMLLSLTGYRALSRLHSRVHSPSNTDAQTFLHSAADSENPQSTTTKKGKGPEIQIMEPTCMKPLGSLPADPHSEEDESEPEDEPESEPASPHAGKAM